MWLIHNPMIMGDSVDYKRYNMKLGIPDLERE